MMPAFVTPLPLPLLTVTSSAASMTHSLLIVEPTLSRNAPPTTSMCPVLRSAPSTANPDRVTRSPAFSNVEPACVVRRASSVPELSIREPEFASMVPVVTEPVVVVVRLARAVQGQIALSWPSPRRPGRTPTRRSSPAGPRLPRTIRSPAGLFRTGSGAGWRRWPRTACRRPSGARRRCRYRW